MLRQRLRLAEAALCVGKDDVYVAASIGGKN